MDNLEKKLLEEVKRFNQIGYNSINLEEQMLGTGGSSGFMQKQGESEKLQKFKKRQQEMSEQDDVASEVNSFAEMGIDDDDVEMETEIPVDGGEDTEGVPAPPAPPVPADTPEDTPVGGTPPPTTPETEEDTTEVEVTDLVNSQEVLEKNTSETNDKLESLMSMLDGMEDKLAGMDQLMNQISNLEQKIEKYRPKSEQEKIESRKQDSGPYNSSLADFWDDSQEKFKSQGKEEYVLTPDDVNNYSETDMKQSFNV